METQDKSETYGYPNQRASIRGTSSAQCYELSDDDEDDLPFVSKNPGRGADEDLAPSRDTVEGSKPVVGSSDPLPRAGAGNGFKVKPLLLKKSGKKLFTRSGNKKFRSLLQFGTKTQDRRPLKQLQRKGPSYNFNTDDRDIKLLLEKYEQVREQYKKAGKKHLEAFRDFRRDFWYLLCNGQESTSGPVQGVNVGMCFTWRAELFLVGLHHRIQAGIDFIPAERSHVWIDNKPAHVAVSVVVTGDFEDDVDEGEKILYCGEGGGTYESGGKGEQTTHQTLTRGNLALYNAAQLGSAVRVIRKHRDASSSSYYIYSYDGLYKVSRAYTQRGKSGYSVYMFELNRLPNQGELRWSDAIGQVMPCFGKDWTLRRVVKLLSAIKENGYEVLFLSARPIAQASYTRRFLESIQQDISWHLSRIADETRTLRWRSRTSSSLKTPMKILAGSPARPTPTFSATTQNLSSSPPLSFHVMCTTTKS